MRTIEVYRNGRMAGTLTEVSRKLYVFVYDTTYFYDPEQPAISLTLPKTQLEYRSEIMFPFFFNMLSEGVNRKLQSKLLKIDEEDSFSLLVATAQADTIGAITVKPIESS